MHAGQQAPAFRLRDGYGAAFSSRRRCVGSIVLVFYREVPLLQHRPPAIEAASCGIRSLGASLVVVSQQTPDNSLETQRRNELSFASLVDAGGKVAHAFGLRWKVSDECVPSRRATAWISRLSTAIRAGRDHAGPVRRGAREIIEYADISVDYTRRGDPSELIPVLAHLAAH